MSKFKILKGPNSFGEQILSLKDRKTAILNSQNIRMLQTHVNNDTYNKYCLIHNINKVNDKRKRDKRFISIFHYYFILNIRRSITIF